MKNFTLNQKRMTLFVLFFCFAELVFAAKWRVRAREHFDTVKLNYNSTLQEESTSGIGPTINVWWEEPYENSIGFAVGLMYINFDQASASVGRGERMELWKTGLEGKHYLNYGKGGAFLRWGLSNNQLRTKGSLGELYGAGQYLGLGWEEPFNILGLAFEVAQRQIHLEKNLSIQSFSPSIGVHFYKHL